MKHIVLGSNLLVKQKEAVKQSKGGIVLPDQSKVKPLRGTIIKVGGNMGTHTFKEGQEILFDRYAGIPVELDDEQYLVMDKTDILIILKE